MDFLILGTLVSLTNWAESVSRNIDRLTLDQQEQLISEAERQVELQGFRDGFVHGLSGFGIRILGKLSINRCYRCDCKAKAIYKLLS